MLALIISLSLICLTFAFFWSMRNSTCPVLARLLSSSAPADFAVMTSRVDTKPYFGKNAE
jgi:hypothetical protein